MFNFLASRVKDHDKKVAHLYDIHIVSDISPTAPPLYVGQIFSFGAKWAATPRHYEGVPNDNTNRTGYGFNNRREASAYLLGYYRALDLAPGVDVSVVQAPAIKNLTR